MYSILLVLVEPFLDSRKNCSELVGALLLIDPFHTSF